jgi:UDP-xylose:glucoside alpha-1,3-xylosyltransferase
MYIDSDALFFDAPEDLWENFKRMNSEQMIGMVEEAPYSTFYKGFYKLQPLIGKYGAMSGGLLLNLTRMRDFGWLNKLIEIHDYYKKKQNSILF